MSFGAGKILLGILILSVISFSSVSAYEYTIPYFDNSVTGATINTDPVSFYVENEENITLYQKLGFVFNTSASSTYNADYESPFDSIYKTATGTLTSNKTCFNIGEADKNALSNSFEARNNLVHDGDDAVTFISTQNKYIIDTTNEEVNISVYNNTDSEDYVYNVFFAYENSAVQVDNDDIISRFNADNYGFCDELSVARTKHSVTVGAVINIAYFYIIFNSTSGNIEWNIPSVTGLENTRESIGLIYKFSDNTVIESHNQIGAFAWTDSNTNLEEDTLYVLALAFEIFAGDTEVLIPDMYVLIDITQADYVCGEWDECDDDGYQYRDCVDVNEVEVDKIESRSCSLVVLANATLGFEEFVRDDDIWKCVPTWNLWCGYELTETYRDSPLNWTIGETEIAKRDFLKMTEEWSTEGSRSLKMWFIPSKMGEVVINASGVPTSCGNTTSGTVPYVSQNISNDSFSVGYDITFPETNMILSFDTKGCTEQVEQHSDLGGVLWSNESGELTYLIDPLCFKNCYASSCYTIPDSRYVFNVLDTVTGSSVLGSPYFETASIDRTDHIKVDISNLGLIAGREYTLVFAVYPENLDNRDGNCVYFDNVRYESISDSLIDSVLGGVCESRCLDEDYYEAKVLSDGECSVVVTEMSSQCSEFSEYIDNLEDFCLDDDTLSRFNDNTADYETIDCVNGCSAGSCLTGEEVAESTLYDCVLGEYCGGLGAFGVFLSIFMIVNYIAILFGIAVLTITKGENPLYAGIVTVMIILGAFAGGIYPVEIGITIIALIVLAVSLYFGRQFVGGG